MSSDDCANCRPSGFRRSLDVIATSWFSFSLLPFFLTLIAVIGIAKHQLYPALSRAREEREGARDSLPLFGKDIHKDVGSSDRRRISRPSAQNLASWVFAVSIGLSAVLVELLLCEVADALDPAARVMALRWTLNSLLMLSVVFAPALEINVITRRIIKGSADSISTRKDRPRLHIVLVIAAFSTWIAMFWYLPQISALQQRLNTSAESIRDQNFTEACLERIGIIGISLMASLSGFAAVSSLWQTFGVRHRVVREGELSRREAGLVATSDMLDAKRSRMRALHRKLAEHAPERGKQGFVGRMMSTIRGGDAEMQELKALEMEVSGLETMQYSLSTVVSNMRNRLLEQQRARTTTGRAWKLFDSIFAVYCAYRICATSLSSLRRWWQPEHSFATSDPINNVLAILTAHWDNDLDRAAWSRLFSFLLSGAMLLASFNAVLQTFQLFARFLPNLIQRAQVSLPLIISEIAGAYVISSALLLRSNLPKEVSSVISDALGAPLANKFVEGWFESWFLVSVGLTATVILVGRKMGNGDDWDDGEDVYEMRNHKRS